MDRIRLSSLSSPAVARNRSRRNGWAECITEHSHRSGGISEPFRLSGDLKLEFNLPAGFGLIVAMARLVWADAHGKAGVRFNDLPTECRNALNQWLIEVERQEGWTVEEVPKD
jgi:hypothetical protein